MLSSVSLCRYFQFFNLGHSKKVPFLCFDEPMAMKGEFRSLPSHLLAA